MGRHLVHFGLVIVEIQIPDLSFNSDAGAELVRIKIPRQRRHWDDRTWRKLEIAGNIKLNIGGSNKPFFFFHLLLPTQLDFSCAMILIHGILSRFMRERMTMQL